MLFSVVRKITASIENRRELLGDEVMITASPHRIELHSSSGLLEFEQLLQGREREFVFTLQTTLLLSVKIIYQSILCSAINKVSNMRIHSTLQVVIYEQ